MAFSRPFETGGNEITRENIMIIETLVAKAQMNLKIDVFERFCVNYTRRILFMVRYGFCAINAIEIK